MPRRLLARIDTAVHAVEVEDVADGLLDFDGGTDTSPPPAPVDPEARKAYPLVEPYAEQIGDFVAAIRERRPPLVDGAEARKALVIVDGLYRSARTGLWSSWTPSRTAGGGRGLAGSLEPILPITRSPTSVCNGQDDDSGRVDAVDEVVRKPA